MRRPPHTGLALCAAVALAVTCLSLAACRSLPNAAPRQFVAAVNGSVYIVRRGWHVDVAVARSDLRPPLAEVAPVFPDAQFVLFGFGDRRYLLHGGNLIAALWPGAGVLLVTGLSGNLTQTFGQGEVAGFALSAQQMSALQTFLLTSLDSINGAITPLAPGPYPGSAYFASPQQYSAAHTCNTWAAEALKSAALPVRSGGVVFAWQLWHQLPQLSNSIDAEPENAAGAGMR
jgi:hypothetical protein